MKNRISFIFVITLWFIVSCSYEDEEGFAPMNGDYEDGSLSGEKYNDFEENPFIKTSEQDVSTFSIDADGASYTNTRRYLTKYNQKPPNAAIRTEEFINYFNYDYPEPTEHPIYVEGEISLCPWADEHKLIKIAMKGKSIPENELPPANYVLLIDVSGSMGDENKLPLLKTAFNLLVDEFSENDRIAIVTYAGSAGVVLPSTSGDQKEKIKNAINSLGSGGSTAGAEGIITAYEIALENFIENGNNRVILASDGDFNVGPSSQTELVELIEEKRESGVFLTVLGVGEGNLNEAMMEQIANNGNGNFEYIDNLEQARKIFIQEYSKFFTVAKDVKVQVKFNPAVVDSYRLIGYENRLLEEEDFENDSTDAGEIGANQSITALYEIIPVQSQLKKPKSFDINVRYKKPESATSIEIDVPVLDTDTPFENASENLRFAASAAGFALTLRDSEYKGSLTYDNVIQWAENARVFDPFGFREEFIQLCNMAKNAGIE